MLEVFLLMIQLSFSSRVSRKMVISPSRAHCACLWPHRALRMRLATLLTLCRRSLCIGKPYPSSTIAVCTGYRANMSVRVPGLWLIRSRCARVTRPSRAYIQLSVALRSSDPYLHEIKANTWYVLPAPGDPGWRSALRCERSSVAANEGYLPPPGFEFHARDVSE